jgi:hypothetical protein
MGQAASASAFLNGELTCAARGSFGWPISTARAQASSCRMHAIQRQPQKSKVTAMLTTQDAESWFIVGAFALAAWIEGG